MVYVEVACGDVEVASVVNIDALRSAAEQVFAKDGVLWFGGHPVLVHCFGEGRRVNVLPPDDEVQLRIIERLAEMGRGEFRASPDVCHRAINPARSDWSPSVNGYMLRCDPALPPNSIVSGDEVTHGSTNE